MPITGVLLMLLRRAIPMGTALRSLDGICAAGAFVAGVIGLKLA
jgi:hypothetical protein